MLDTHVFLWYLSDSQHLSSEARSMIAAADAVFVSAASIWEVAIKVGTGKLKASTGRIVEEIGQIGFTELPVTARHCAMVASLPPIHRDPFDRLLVAQAMYEPLQFLTADSILQGYSQLVVLV